MMEPALRRISLQTLEAAMQDAAQVDKMIKGCARKRMPATRGTPCCNWR
jgi:DNA polymerase-3 subunit delta